MLLTTLQRLLRSYYFARLRDPSGIVNSDDLVQETLMTLHEKLHTFQKDRAFLPWFYAIAKYKMIDSYRRNKNAYLSDSEALLTLGTEEDTLGINQDLEKILKPLSDKQRQVLLLAKVEGYSVKEIAEQTGFSESDVKVSIHRALEALKNVGDLS